MVLGGGIHLMYGVICHIYCQRFGISATPYLLKGQTPASVTTHLHFHSRAQYCSSLSHVSVFRIIHRSRKGQQHIYIHAYPLPFLIPILEHPACPYNFIGPPDAARNGVEAGCGVLGRRGFGVWWLQMGIEMGNWKECLWTTRGWEWSREG